MQDHFYFSSELPEIVEWELDALSFPMAVLLFDGLDNTMDSAPSISLGHCVLLRLLHDLLRRDFLLLRDLHPDLFLLLLHLLLPCLLRLFPLLLLLLLQRSSTLASQLFMQISLPQPGL